MQKLLRRWWYAIVWPDPACVGNVSLGVLRVEALSMPVLYAMRMLLLRPNSLIPPFP